MNYAVVDLPMLSNAEQCADACMRLKAEYLYQTGQYKRLNFKTSTASPCATAVGHREKPFTAISADSMVLPVPSHSAARCSPVHWQISNPVTSLSTPEMADCLVMPSSLSNKNGKKAFLLVEGNTPARDIHLIRNLENPFRSPWFISDGSEKRFLLCITPFKATDLRHY